MPRGLAALAPLLLLVACAQSTAPAASPSPSPTAAATSVPAPATPTASPVPATPASPTPPTDGVRRPNPGLTPGEVFPSVSLGQICTPGYTATVRSVTSEQRRLIFGAYGIPYPQPAGTYELDHLISLELGGDNATANLWPQPASPAPGFHQKDALENEMHRRVCAGTLDLATAQHEIASDWYQAYLKYVSP